MDLGERIARLLAGWDPQRSPAELLALGAPALELLLNAKDGKPLPPAGGNPRDVEDALQSAIAAFGARDVDGVLAELKRRGWTHPRIVLSGMGRVADPRIVLMLLELSASKDSLDRLRAVRYLGLQPDPRATEALRLALKDRNESVRLAAIEHLGGRGDSGSIEALQDLAKKSSQKPWIAAAAKSAVAKIRKASKRG